MALSNIFGWNKEDDKQKSAHVEQRAEQQHRKKSRQHVVQPAAHLTSKK